MKPEEFYFTHLTTTDGLSDSKINDMVQDRLGFMWFATGLAGLNRYDGYEFKFYQHDPNVPRSLSQNIVTALFLDHLGILWIGTESGGLNRYDRDTDDFTRFLPNPDDETSLPSGLVRAISEDASGVLWVGTEKGGLSRLDRATGKFRTYRHDPNNPGSLSEETVDSLFCDPDTGQLWVGTRKSGVCMLAKGATNFIQYRSDANAPGSISGTRGLSFCKDRSGTLWIGTDGGLNRFVPESGTFVHYRNDPKDTNSISSDWIWAIYEDSRGRFWICTPGGVNLMDRDRGTFGHLPYYGSDASQHLLGQPIVSICEDNTGAIWFGHVELGVSRLHSEPPRFTAYRTENEGVNVVYVDRNDRVWIGTIGGLDFLEGGHPPLQQIHFPEIPSLSVHAVAEDGEGGYWVGAFPQGMFHLHGNEITRLPAKPEDPTRPVWDEIWAFVPDPRKGLWVVYWTKGVDYFDGQTFVRYPPDAANPQRLPEGVFYSCATDGEGMIWLAGPGGLSRLDPSTAVFTTFQIDPEHPENQVNRSMAGVFADRQSPGEVWVGTSSGLFQFDKTSGRFTRHYTKQDGLCSDGVQAIERDYQGRLWLGTLNGLSCFDPKRGTFRNYDIADGLPGKKFFHGAADRTSDGRLFFGTAKGLVTFDPSRMPENPHPPPVVLTDFELFNKPVSVGGENSPLRKAIDVAEEITLTHYQSVFSFKFAALNFTAPEENLYAYKMEGFDDDWSYTDAKRRFATYTRLAPGHYTFRVKASNNDGLWNEQGTSIKITILPPWWQTWWFRSMAAITLVGVVAAGFRWRLKSITRRAAELKLEVAQRTSSLSERTKELVCAKAEADGAREKAEVASRAKSEFLSSMSHELRTPLNAILGYTQLLARQQNLTEKQQQQLGIMYSSGEHLLGLISDILDLGRIEAQKTRLESAVFNLPKALEQAVRLTQVKAEEKALTLAYEARTALPEYVISDERMLKQILLNLLSNAVKYTRQGGATLWSEYDARNGGRLRCEVVDTGVGIPPDQQAVIFEPFTQLQADGQVVEGSGLGLSITKRLVGLMGGQMGLESEPGKGSRFWFEVPMPAAGNAAPVGPMAERSVIGYHGERKRVLVVDDNATNVAVLASLLEPLGFTVATANNGEAALRLAMESPPDLVLLDLVMPGISGLEVAKAIRERTELARTRIIGISATVTDSERKRAFDAVCDGFVGKPMQVDVLFEKMGALLELTWEIAPSAESVSAATQPVTAPLAAILEAMREAVTEGDYRALDRILEEQMSQDPAHAAFYQEIRRHAARYDDERILALLAATNNDAP
ncbi:MAG: two-component regulator propeller domain-containing protein [Luteolibacter sp.]